MKTRLATCACVLLLAGCGQTGRLYLPESTGEVITRPTQTPPPESGTETGEASNSPQTVDSPSAPDTPTPEVTAPEGGVPRPDADKKNGATNAPPESTPKN
jgi:predicted small lipoprotein YifL